MPKRGGEGGDPLDRPHLDGRHVGLGIKLTATAPASPHSPCGHPSSHCSCTPPFDRLRITHSSFSFPIRASATTSSSLEHHHSKILVRTTTPWQRCRQIWISVWQIQQPSRMRVAFVGEQGRIGGTIDVSPPFFCWRCWGLLTSWAWPEPAFATIEMSGADSFKSFKRWRIQVEFGGGCEEF